MISQYDNLHGDEPELEATYRYQQEEKYWELADDDSWKFEE